ncbi:hypothetical protein LUZ63_000917 [Rhynchospora breviuscula]|uniref:DYW domain-containing protein n=1 Tax=Rhynchospora breviuscula TaxID=2022672 RepID=A0A9Q0CVU2_9POAL|nr:hypothetical protein LUZ63_000917 [Rhynchospora breviuscula]
MPPPPPTARATSHLPSLPPPPASYNSLIRTYARSSVPSLKLEALRLYHSLLLDPSAPPPNRYTFPFVLKSCAFFSFFSEGSQLHSHVVKFGLACDTYVANSLVHFYSSCGKLACARKVFDKISEKSRVSWNVIIDACVTNGDYQEALALFREMQVEKFVPDIYTFQSVIGACTGIGSLSLGMWAHKLMLRSTDRELLLSDALVNNSLIDLYSKCGSIALARKVFDEMPVRDIASWNIMILGLAMHGLVDESIDYFTRMTSIEKLRPNAITFIAVLSACNHGGLVSEGKKYFDSMVNHYRIEPRIEHYGCIIDILARAGFIEEALETVSKMPCKPDAVIWRSLLDACCKKNAGLELSELLARQALEVKDDATSGVYVMLSRVYASANRWNDVALVRRLMSEDGVKKEPGFSSIELDDGTMHQFVAGDTCHPRSEEIYDNLQTIEKRLELQGYRPDSSQAPMIEGVAVVKGDSLRLHSERLAISFGLLTGAGPGRPIRILKNLRVCKDCHTMTKLVSQVYQAEIIVRDRIRFHHFRDGKCSCMDYW